MRPHCHRRVANRLVFGVARHTGIVEACDASGELERERELGSSDLAHGIIEGEAQHLDEEVDGVAG